ncbi:MAG TPA: ArsR family transcriptional regulator [Thermoanaerobaculia bacterium]
MRSRTFWAAAQHQRQISSGRLTERHAVLYRLHLPREGEVCVSDLVTILHMPQPTISRHLAYPPPIATRRDAEERPVDLLLACRREVGVPSQSCSTASLPALPTCRS